MADLGKVVVTDGGVYSDSTTYEKLTFVTYDGDTYMTLKTVTGITPSDDGINYRLFCKSAELARMDKAGTVIPDGTTTEVDENGTLSAILATASNPGIVMPASSDFSVSADGTQKINLQFEQATALANIIAGEAFSIALGKISKAIATTMSLDQNALLKNMMTSIQANDVNKVPTAALAYAMNQQITTNTNAITQLNSDLDQKTDGIFVLPGGLKLCWGRCNSQSQFTFPVAYTMTPRVFISSFVGASSAAAGYTYYTGVGSITLTSFIPYCWYLNNKSANNVPVLGTDDCMFFSVGY